MIFCKNGVWIDRDQDGYRWQKHKYPKIEEHFDRDVVLQYRRYEKLKKLATIF